MNAPNYITSHSRYTESDYNHLKSKGYTNREILAIWNRDQAEGKDPVGEWTWNTAMEFFTTN